MITIILIISGLLNLCLGYIVWNLNRKNNFQTDILTSYIQYLNKITDIIDFSDRKLKEIDHKGSFESDDEIGWFFKQIKQIQETLNNFKIKNV